MVIGVAIVILAIAGAVVFGQWLASPDRSALKECRQAIESRLVAPTTARFRDGYVNGSYAYWTVDAQNAFGAILTKQFSCKQKGTLWVVQQ